MSCCVISERLLHRLGVLDVERDDVEQVARLAGAGARALDDLARTHLTDLLRERPDAVRPAGGEGASRHVRPVVENLQRMRDALPRLRPDAVEACSDG